MLDIQYIRDNKKKVKNGVAAKGYDIQLIDKVLDLDRRQKELIQLIENLRAERNKAAKAKDVEKGKLIKAQLAKKEPELEQVEKKFKEALLMLPNLPQEGVPVGKDESDNKIVRQLGEIKKFDFKPKDHLELGETLGILDFERGSKVSGSGFYYLKNDGVLLELALVQYGMEFLIKRGYVPFITPDLAHERYYLGTGYLPRGPEAQTYTINDSDLGLIATSEVTLAGFHSDEILNRGDLPKKYAGFSHCFRVEAGGYGKYSKGLYRVHQFSKVEMYVYCVPEQSVALFHELLANEEEFWKSLGIPYRVVEMCSGDLGAQAASKFDIEAWMPGRGDWGEVTSCSNTTDYQARRLNLKYKKGDKNQFVHNLNGTLVATPRAIIAILENYQQKDGSVVIPEVLRKWIKVD